MNLLRDTLQMLKDVLYDKSIDASIRNKYFDRYNDIMQRADNRNNICKKDRYLYTCIVCDYSEIKINECGLDGRCCPICDNGLIWVQQKDGDSDGKTC